MGSQGGVAYPVYIRGCGTPTNNVQGGPSLPVHIVGSDIDVTNQEVENLIASGMVRQGTTWHAYGGFQNANQTIVIPGVNAWTHVTNGTNNLWYGIEATGVILANDIMTFVYGGDYAGSLSVTFSALPGKDYELRLYNITQGTQMGYEIGASTTGTTNFTNINLPLYIEANAGDQMRVEIQCVTDGTNVIVRSAVFYINYVHD